ncbi:MAG: hypothetical protein KBC17_02955 [Candidatus Pacebacteria bacterium]|nr:hypothetical protein [Candidatus Paceibacterota bacterium]
MTVNLKWSQKNPSFTYLTSDSDSLALINMHSIAFHCKEYAHEDSDKSQASDNQYEIAQALLSGKFIDKISFDRVGMGIHLKRNISLVSVKNKIEEIIKEIFPAFEICFL